MAIPAAPQESGGEKLLFLVYDNAASNSAALLHAVNVTTVNGESYGDLVVTLDGESVTVRGATITTFTHGTAGVGTASTTALDANASRLYALITNDSDTTMYLGLGAAAVLNNGVRVGPNGGAYEMSAQYGNLFAGTVFAIHGGSGTKRSIATEGV